MPFEERSQVSITLIDIVRKHFWDSNELQSLCHVETGYETQEIPEDVRSLLRNIRNKTTRHIRFTPDFLIVDRENSDNIYYLEYKCTQTIGYYQDRGQCELDAYDNYKALHDIGVRVALLNYVAYYDRLLLCDFIENIKELHRSEGLTRTTRGSGTPYINHDLNGMRTLLQFLVDTHGINRDTIAQIFDNACAELQSELPMRQRHGLLKAT